MSTRTIKQIWNDKYKDIAHREISDMSLKEFMIYNFKFTFPFVVPAVLIFTLIIYLVGGFA